MMFGIWLNEEDAEILKGWRDYAVWLGSAVCTVNAHIFRSFSTCSASKPDPFIVQDVQGTLYFHVLYTDFSSILLCAKFNVCASIQRFRCKVDFGRRTFLIDWDFYVFELQFDNLQTKVKLIEKHGLESVIVDMNEKLPPKYRRSANKDELK